MNEHLLHARLTKARKLATVCRKQRIFAEDIIAMDDLGLKLLASVAEVSIPSEVTVSMVVAMLDAQPPARLTREEMEEQERAFDAHLLTS